MHHTHFLAVLHWLRQMNTLGQVAYRAFYKSVGDASPGPFDQLTPSVQLAWEESAKAVAIIDALAKAAAITKCINELNSGEPVMVP